MQNNSYNIIFIIIMQTIIGIGICLIVVVYFSIGFMNTYHEGMTAPASDTTSGPKVVANASGVVSLKTVAQNIQTHVDAIGQTVGIIDNSTNIATYTDIIDNLLNYYDYQILSDIANAQPNSNGKYDLNNIIRYKEIKIALNDSLDFLQLPH